MSVVRWQSDTSSTEALEFGRHNPLTPAVDDVGFGQESVIEDALRSLAKLEVSWPSRR
jgi:hypothetical protein